MIYNVLKATCENPVKNDFVLICKKYLENLKINLSFEKIAKLSKFQFNKILKEKIEIAAFTYLKTQQNKQEKIKEINYSKLEIQEYLINGDRNPKVLQLIYKFWTSKCRKNGSLMTKSAVGKMWGRNLDKKS